MGDRVDPRDHLAVRMRDRMCFGILLYNAQRTPQINPWVEGIPWVPYHRCRTRFGQEHAATDLALLTVDHFHRHHGGTKGKRAASTLQTMVAMCAWLNDRPPSSDIRVAERAYVSHLYGPPD